MEKVKTSFNLLKLLSSKLKSKNSANQGKTKEVKHQPRWMYRNE